MLSNKIITIITIVFTCVGYMYIMQMNRKVDKMQQLLHDQQQTISYQNDVIIKLGAHVKFLANEHRTQSNTTPISID